MDPNNTWELGLDGFVMQYMIAGPKVEDFTSTTSDPEQLILEAKLRNEIVSEKTQNLTVNTKLGQLSNNGCIWEVYAPFGSCFIDKSDFYSTLKKINIEAATGILLSEKRSVKARIWTYMSAAVYVNGVKLGENVKPVYKPMQFFEVTLPLEKGLNEVYFLCENLGVRDTRNILGIQLLGDVSGVRVTLPDVNLQSEVYRDELFLANTSLQADKVVFPYPSPEGVQLRLVDDNHDYYAFALPNDIIFTEGLSEVDVPTGIATVKIQTRRTSYSLSRTLELGGRRQPLLETGKASNNNEHLNEIMGRIASIKSMSRVHFGFSIMHILARKFLGTSGPEDRELLFNDLDLIERRVDCSDFLVCGLIRFMKNYPLDGELSARIKKVLLDFRYWMNMQGTDGMCFWSENHAILFYTSSLLIGELYPDEFFSRANMTGRELSAFGRDKVYQWLDDVETFGFEEFQSSVYMSVTFAALLNLVDYAASDISQRAELLCDRILKGLCLQAFKGCVISPMGRVYRNNIYPFASGTQSIMNWIDPTAPYSFGEGWLAYIATSKYQAPEKLQSLMHEEVTTEYSTGNALIKVEKTKDYILTSAQSPRLDGWTRWPNVRSISGTDTDTHQFTKSMNESFHGTSFFEPGIFGYQQHLWSAALSSDAVLFVNHPGTSAEASDLRPGYWHGNGVLPAIKQEKSVLGAIYVIPEEHPIHFTHVFCQLSRYDETKVDEHWLFLKKDSGFLALWSSGKLEPYNDMLFNSEYRVYSNNNAYVCFTGSVNDFSSFQSFVESSKHKMPSYDPDKYILTAKDFHLTYVKGKDNTQYIA